MRRVAAVLVGVIRPLKTSRVKTGELRQESIASAWRTRKEETNVPIVLGKVFPLGGVNRHRSGVRKTICGISLECVTFVAPHKIY